MRKGYTAVIKKTTDWWIGWIEEVPGVNCQEPTREALLETLKVTLQEALGGSSSHRSMIVLRSRSARTSVLLR